MPNFIQGVKSFVAWEWISSVTKSLFKLASYIVELPMVASGVYIMIATGIPDANNSYWFNLAFGVLLSAPEVLAPGAFFRAETMEQRGKQRAARVTRWIAGAMLLFAALTFSSVMIFHFPTEVLQAIMFCRVMTAMGYSIITRIDMDHGAGQGAHASPHVDSWALVGLTAHLQAGFEKQLMELASTQKTALTELAEQQLQKMNLVDLQMKRLVSEVQELQEEPEWVAPEIDYQHLAVALSPLFEQRMNASVSAIKTTIIEEVRATLPMAPAPRQIEARARSQSRSQSQEAKANKVDSEPVPGPSTIPPARSNGNPEERLQATYELLLSKSVRVSGRLLAKEAHVNRGVANKWLSELPEPGEKLDSEPLMMVDSEPGK